MIVGRVPIADILAESELIAEYAAECSIPLIGEIDPQREQYAAMEAAGILKCFAAYLGGRMVGFVNALITGLPHYGKRVATIESLFVAEKHRGGQASAELMKAVEEYARQVGCAAILYSAPAVGRLEKLLDMKKNYKRTNTIFCRSLH
jgi:GNAT superfamily N-acetyltransferase